MKVLVVEDEASTRAMVRHVLEREGVCVVEASDGGAALAVFRGGDIDVVLLDLGLPDMSGLDLLERLRDRDPTVVVVMLTAADSEADRVRGLLGGADDYVVKPFSLRELAARVMALSRRIDAGRAAVLRHGPLEIDTRARQVTRDGEPVELTPRELDLLVHLVRNPGVTFTRAQLLHAVWQSSEEWQDEATVTEHVRRLRIKLDQPGEPSMLVTVRRSGYRLDPPEPSDPPIAHSRARHTRDATIVIVGTTIVYATDTAVALVAAGSPREIVGRDVFEFVAPSSVEASRARHESAKAGHWPRPETIVVRRVDGAEVPVLLASMPVEWEGHPATQATMWELGSSDPTLGPSAGRGGQGADEG